MHDAPVLVGCAHGTRDPAGRRVTDALLRDVAAERPGIEVVEAFVEASEPSLGHVLAVLAGRPVVVVPLLLSAGFHVFVDIADAVRAAGPAARAAHALGPDAALVELLARRLTAAGTPPGEPVLLAAAGSSDRRAIHDVETVAAGLARERRAPVRPCYLSAAQPSVPDAVAAARAAGEPVHLASYLLAPGYFADRLADLDADTRTDTLAPHPLLTDLVLRRYDAAW